MSFTRWLSRPPSTYIHTPMCHPTRLGSLAVLLSLAALASATAQQPNSTAATPAQDGARVSDASIYRVYIPLASVGDGLYGECPVAPARISEDATPAARDSLSVRVVQSRTDTAAVSASNSLEILVRGQRFDVISKGASATPSRDAPAKTLDGAAIEVIRYPAGTRVCSARLSAPARVQPSSPTQLPATTETVEQRTARLRREARARRLAGLDTTVRAFRDDEFVLRTGAEYASVDGFRTRGTQIQGSVEYNLALGYGTLGEFTGINKPREWLGIGNAFGLVGLLDRPFRLTTTANAERITTFKTQARYRCVGRRERIPIIIPGEPPYPAPRPACANPDTLSAEEQIFYSPSRYESIFDTDDVLGSWQVSDQFRLETPLFDNRGVFVGPMATVGFLTDPTGGFRGLESFIRYGLSFRQVDANGKERFSVTAMRGPIFGFRERVQVYDTAFVRTHPEINEIYASRGLRTDSAGTVRAVIPENPVEYEGMSYRLMYRPFGTLHLRGIGHFPNRGRALVSFAVMLAGDLKTILQGFGFNVPDEKLAATPAPAPPPAAPQTTTSTP